MGWSCVLQLVSSVSSFAFQELKKVNLAFWPQTERIINLFLHTSWIALPLLSYKLLAFLPAIQPFYCLSRGGGFRQSSSTETEVNCLGKRLGAVLTYQSDLSSLKGRNTDLQILDYTHTHTQILKKHLLCLLNVKISHFDWIKTSPSVICKM